MTLNSMMRSDDELIGNWPISMDVPALTPKLSTYRARLLASRPASPAP